jgi:hypothetical protein
MENSPVFAVLRQSCFNVTPAITGLLTLHRAIDREAKPPTQDNFHCSFHI